MRIQNVQNNNNYRTTFNGKIADSGALRRFKAGLSDVESQVYNSCVSTIEKTKDKYTYVFDYIEIGRPIRGKRIAAISIQNSDKTVQHPPILADKPEKALDLFKRLAAQYAEKQQ